MKAHTILTSSKQEYLKFFDEFERSVRTRFDVGQMFVGFEDYHQYVTIPGSKSSFLSQIDELHEQAVSFDEFCNRPLRGLQQCAARNEFSEQAVEADGTFDVVIDSQLYTSVSTRACYYLLGNEQLLAERDSLTVADFVLIIRNPGKLQSELLQNTGKMHLQARYILNDMDFFQKHQVGADDVVLSHDAIHARINYFLTKSTEEFINIDDFSNLSAEEGSEATNSGNEQAPFYITQQPLYHTFKYPQNAYLQSAFERQQFDVQDGYSTGESGLSAIHYAIIGRNVQGVKLLAANERFCVTGQISIELGGAQYANIPRGANCLYLAKVLEFRQAYDIFCEFSDAQVDGHFTDEIVISRGEAQLQAQVSLKSVSSCLRAAIQHNNVQICRKILDSGIVQPRNLESRCQELRAQQCISQCEADIISFVTARREQPADIFEMRLENFSDVFGAKLGRCWCRYEDYFCQEHEISAFFDRCIAGTAADEQLERYRGVHDQRRPTGLIVHGFTGQHYLAYYGHKYADDEAVSGRNTVIRFERFDLLLEDGIQVRDCDLLRRDQENCVLSDLRGRYAPRSNFELVVALQGSAEGLAGFFQAGDRQTIESAVDAIRGRQIALADIYQFRREDERTLRMLDNSIARYDTLHEQQFGYSSAGADVSRQNYVLEWDQLVAPEYVSFCSYNAVFDDAKCKQLSQEQLRGCDAVDMRQSSISSGVYHQFTPLMYAILFNNYPAIKELLPAFYNRQVTQSIIFKNCADQIVYLPANSSVLHFALLSRSDYYDYVYQFCSKQQLEYTTSFCALCVSWQREWSNKYLEYELANINVLEELLYQIVKSEKANLLGELINKSPRQLQNALAQQYNNEYIVDVAECECKALLQNYLNNCLIQSGFDEKFAKVYKCSSAQELKDLYTAYVNGSLAYDFCTNTQEECEFYEECIEKVRFTNESFKCKGKRDTRRNDDNNKIINGFTGLLYAIFNNNTEAVMELFPSECSMEITSEEQVGDAIILAGTLPLKIILLVKKHQVFAELVRKNYDVCKEQIEDDYNDYLEVMISQDYFDSNAVSFCIEKLTEEQIMDVVQEHSNTRIGESLVERLKSNEVFIRAILNDKASSSELRQLCKAELFKLNYSEFQKMYGAEETERYKKQLAENTARDASDRKESIASDTLSAESCLFDPNWFDTCASGAVKGTEKDIGSVDKRQTDLDSNVINGFTGLMYAIINSNTENIKTLMEKEYPLFLKRATQLKYKNKVIELDEHTYAIQLAILYNLEHLFSKVQQIPPGSNDYYIFSNRIPRETLTVEELNYCIDNKQNGIIEHALKSLDAAQQINLINSKLQQPELESVIYANYMDSGIERAVAKRFGEEIYTEKDLNYSKSVGLGTSDEQCNNLFYALLSKDFDLTRKLFFSEKECISAIDVIVANRFVARGSSIYHVLPFTSLDIVLWVIERADCCPTMCENRFGDTFVDIAVQVNSNASLIVLDKFGKLAVEKSFVTSVRNCIRFENVQMLNIIMQYCRLHKNQPISALLHEKIETKTTFGNCVLDAFMCQAFCQNLAGGWREEDRDFPTLIRQLNNGFIMYLGGSFVVEGGATDADDAQAEDAAKEFEGFDAVAECMREKWRNVGALVMKQPINEVYLGEAQSKESQREIFSHESKNRE